MKTKINLNITKELETRIIDAGIQRILQCINRLDEDQIQYRPNANSNSINNQILHLDGNVRQWLISTMSSATDIRERDKEFDPQNQKTKPQLIAILEKLEADIRSVFNDVNDIILTEEQTVQCYTETNLSILIHVIEHFSYHVGQITYITKMLLDVDTGYYNGQDLNQVN